MNRREFCFSLGAAVVGGSAVVCGGAVCSARSDIPIAPVVGDSVLPTSFRAKKVFPEQWQDVLSLGSVSEQTRLLRQSLREFVGNDTALVVASLSGLSPEFLKLLQTESLRAGLELYLPAWFPFEATFCDVTTNRICPLRITQHGIETAKPQSVSCDGFLFSLSGKVGGLSSKPHGMILCDPSRGTWQTFLCHTFLRQSDVPQGHRNPANLQTARWLDFAKKRKPVI